ncbi:hypothetical protein [Succinivibrio dextrinosolvens]|jgi:hypothetical protein|uniref:hypothetical protein n=1 Tax=Succinivibrio dextrinosolvens TaxID=83771 RepID=UPI00241C37D7|nr:hypothetical protein [Succinivibrio dextrinosolvens]MBE6423077.1 hypothetical protein [Succinivibrio dextrinosolvens]
MFRILSLATLIMALGIIFAPEATLNYVHTVISAVKEQTGLGNARQQLQNEFLNTLGEGKDMINSLLK